MWRSKKLIIAAILTVVVLVGSIGGIALAQENGDDNGDNSQPQTLLARVAAILGIDQQELEDAFTQAKSEMRDEALDKRLQKLVAEGVIDPEQATAYKEWLQARPDMEPFRQQLREWQETRPGAPLEMEEWQKARPDIPFRFGFKGRVAFRGMGGMRGFGGRCVPTQ